MKLRDVLVLISTTAIGYYLQTFPVSAVVGLATGAIILTIIHVAKILSSEVTAHFDAYEESRTQHTKTNGEIQ